MSVTDMSSCMTAIDHKFILFVVQGLRSCWKGVGFTGHKQQCLPVGQRFAFQTPGSGDAKFMQINELATDFGFKLVEL